MDNDVIVVGAGSAGCFSAFHAAKLGVQVIICEEHSEVGVPSHCTGHVSRDGLKRFNLSLPENVLENEIDSVIFYSPSGYTLKVRFSYPVTYVINRERFDQHLCNMAQKKGVEVLNHAHVDSLIFKDQMTRGVVIKEKNETRKLTSRVVIDAEGVSSTLLKRAGLPSLNYQLVANGVQAEVDKIDNIQNSTVEVFLGRDFTSGFFAWIVPHQDGKAKVGLGTTQNNPKDCLRNFIRHHPIARRRLKFRDVKSLVYHPISLGGPISRTFYDGLLIVGDAASQVKPTTGGGLIMGLTCAKIAGEVAASAIHRENSTAAFLSEYEQLWRRRIGFEMMVMKHIRIMLNRLSDKQLDRLVALSTRLELSKTLNSVADIDFQGTSLVQLIKNPKFLLTTLYFLIASFL
ncbi:MAG: NAD(P)/FAD-dependent oxidoreductase [Candidatus Bathyarchaeota archaeon]|nr:MAG: NAD(P)/FAD-dependent oxidoreductase [Candidatus Bathyarchaeota archaeon]